MNNFNDLHYSRTWHLSCFLLSGINIYRTPENTMGLSTFQTSTLGMMSQAHGLNNIGQNIANVSTGGYKRIDTRFTTMLSNNLRTGPGAGQINFSSQERGLGGVVPKDYQTLDQQGLLQPTERSLDLAIAGDGFFQISPTVTTGSEIFFTRDGSFQVNVAGAEISVTGDDGTAINVKQGYLADKNGYFLLGVAAAADRTFPSASSLQTMRVDQYAFTNMYNATTTGELNLNLPAQKKFTEANETISLTVVDSNGKERALTATFVKSPTANTWQMMFSADNLTTTTPSPGAAFSLSAGAGAGTLLKLDPSARSITASSELIPAANTPGAFMGLRVGDSITLGGTPTNNGTYSIGAISADFTTITVTTGTPLPGAAETATAASTATSARVVSNSVVFNANGQLTSPTSITAGLTWSDGATNSVALDISNMTQLYGDFTPLSYAQNGLASSDMTSVHFDGAGHVVGQFTDGSSRKIYKVPLATFTNVNGLEATTGNVYIESPYSGAARSVFADTSGIAEISPNTLELSNVDLALQFTQMIQVQQAYNSSATVFKTVDEMLMVVRDLKA